MRATFVLGAVILCLFAPIGIGGPIGGGVFERIKGLSSKEPWTLKKRFRAGERAVVLVRSENPAEAQLHVLIFDAKDQLVVEDQGRNVPVPGMAAVFWVPPREAEYKIEVRNLANSSADCYATIK